MFKLRCSPDASAAMRTLRRRARACLLASTLACAPAAAGDVRAVGKQELASAHANAIQRYLFAADSFAGVAAAFADMGVVFDVMPGAPAPGGSAWATGTGPSGFPAPYRIDRVGNRFHVHAERRRPQHPVAPVPYVEQDVVFDTPDEAVSPVGTLTYPASGSAFPAIVLVAGSGPHGRDGGMSLHKTLLVLADHLTRAGFAVLRYDKRGVGLTGGALHPGSTTDGYAADALAAVRYLQTRPEIDPRRIGIVGHSEGGIIAAMVAASAPEEVAFVVMLAGTGLPGVEVKSLQDAAARRAEGMPEALVLLNQSQERGLLEIAAGTLGHGDALAAMVQATEAVPADDKVALEIPSGGIPVEVYESLLSPWFRRFLQLDPRAYLAQVRCPVLALVGEKDLQVPPGPNLVAIAAALRAGANPPATVRALPGINHNLQTARTGKASEYFLIEETVAPLVLESMSNWLDDVARREQHPVVAARR